MLAFSPELLRQELEAERPRPGTRIVIDEIQQAPAPLDEVHRRLWDGGHLRV